MTVIPVTAVLLTLGACAPTAFDPGHPFDRDGIVLAARACLGAPYRWGGATPAGFDCSGLVCHVYRQEYGLSLPHNSSALYRRTKTVTMRNAARGDLVFFSEDRRGTVTHVGIYLGGARFIHATSSRGVIISSLDEPYYRRRFLAVRQVPLPRS
ncbi:C40 family peptidase [bacterium]|nr:C40 family peptidase [bacterium]